MRRNSKEINITTFVNFEQALKNQLPAPRDDLRSLPERSDGCSARYVPKQSERHHSDITKK